MLFLQSLICRLKWSQRWRHGAVIISLLACMCCCAMMLTTVQAAAHSTFTRPMHHSPLLSEGRGFRENLRLKLERLPGPHKDRYQALRAAAHRDHVRRQALEQRLLAGIENKVASGALTPGSNGSASSTGGAGLQNASLNVISGSSVGSGEYFASVSLGTPPQNVFLIADTGSDLTWVKCGASTKSVLPGLATNQSFDEGASSTFAPLSCLSGQCAAWFFPPTCDDLSGHCAFSYSYTDESFITGSLGFETITLGEHQQANVVLGCGRQYAGSNFEKAGGVLGLGQGPLSLASQLTTQSAYSNKFSYCFADFFGSSTIFGSLAFGETHFQHTLKYTPLIQNPYVETFYYVQVEKVRVGGVALDIPADVWEMDGQGNGGTIVDSGTTLTQFAKPAYDAIRDAFRQAIQEMPVDAQDSVPGLDLCYKGNTSAGHFPELAIVLDGGLALEPPLENYFTEPAPGITCLAMQEAAAGSFSVIGNLMQQNFHIEFDRLHNRLGVFPTDCSKIHS